MAYWTARSNVGFVLLGCLATANAAPLKPESTTAPATSGTPAFMSNFLMNFPPIGFTLGAGVCPQFIGAVTLYTQSSNSQPA